MMNTLSNKTLIEAYYCAKFQDLNANFIGMLKDELHKRLIVLDKV